MSGILPLHLPPSRTVFAQGRRRNDIGRAQSMAAFIPDLQTLAIVLAPIAFERRAPRVVRQSEMRRLSC
ncbi:hypothetical protein ABIC60_004957 [Phyllobacterium ifriqiyense]